MLTKATMYDSNSRFHGLTMIRRRIIHAICNLEPSRHHFAPTNLQMQGLQTYNTIKVKCVFCPAVYNVRLQPENGTYVTMWKDGEAEPVY